MPDFTREELAHIGTVGINQGTKYADVAAFALRLLDERDDARRTGEIALTKVFDMSSARAKDVEALRIIARFAITRPSIDLAKDACAAAKERLAAWEKDNA